MFVDYLIPKNLMTNFLCIARSSTSFVDPLFYANRAGVLAVSQLTFIVALAGKNNAISGNVIQHKSIFYIN